MRSFVFRSVVALAVLGLASGAFAQTFQGGVRGVIQDSDGGVLPGVSVTLENEDTGVSRTSVSNAVGEYSFANIQAGDYTLRAELSGFAPFVSEGLIVGVASFLVVDATLSVGGIEETVTVTGETPLIETATASVSSAVSRAELEVLPTPGRNVFILAVGTPNVVHVGNPVWVKQSDQTNSSLLSLGGGPLRGNNYTVDGVSTTDLRNRTVIIPVFEAIQEMKVQTNTYDAEMGRTGGGVFNVIHRTGTNQWAGSALYQHRPARQNTWYRSLNFTDQLRYDDGGLTDDQIPERPFNLGGGSFGGPLLQDRTFFWVSAEGSKDLLADSTSVTLPTAAMASGDFSATGRTIYNPFEFDADGNRVPFPGNRIPQDMIDPAGAQLAQLLTTLGSGNVPVSGAQETTAFQSTGNISHTFSDDWQSSLTYMYYTSGEGAFQQYTDLLGADEAPDFGIGSAILYRDVHAVAFNNSFITGDSSVLTLRLGYTYFNDSVGNPAYGADQIRSLGIQGSFLDALYAQDGYEGQFPEIDVSNYGDGGETHGSWSNNDVQWGSREVSGTYSQFVGNHTLKYGAQYRRMGLHAAGFGNGFALTFDQRFTQGPNPTSPDSSSGDALAELLLGIPTGGSATIADAADVYIDYFGGFVQDDWRPSTNLVLNLGLRIEHETGLSEESNGLTVGWDRDNPFPVQVALVSALEGTLPGFPLRGGLMYAGADGNPTHQWDPPAAKFGPRFGFAYTLNPETVVRGGYAVFWAPYALPSGTGASSIGTYGYTEVTSFVASGDGITPAAGRASNPFPNGINQPEGNARGRLQNIGGNVYFNEQFRASPYIHKWSFDFQRDIGNDLALKVGYVGSRGANLAIGGTNDSTVNINQLNDQYLSLGDRLNDKYPNPFHGDSRFGSLSNDETLPLGQLLRPYPHFRNVLARHVSGGKSVYNSLRVELDKRFRGNWGARINYTFTDHRDSIYEGNQLLEDETGQVYNTPDACAFAECPTLDADYGPSRLHVPHQFSVNATYRTPGDHPVFGGWALSAVALYRSGFPLVVTQNSNPLSAYGFNHQRPSSIGIDGGGDPASGAAGTTVQYITPGTSAATEGLALGTAPHTVDGIRSPFLINWDMSLEKTTRVYEDMNLTLRFEFIDAFNHVNWRGPRTVLGRDNFGTIPGTRGYPRTFQFMAKVTF